MKFQRTIGINYSGAETPDSGLKGLRVFMTNAGGPADEVSPPPGGSKYWARRELSHWLRACLAEPIPTVAAIDHAFSFPESYFKRHGVKRDWDIFLDDFYAYWPTDREHYYVDSLRQGRSSTGADRSGLKTWFRVTDKACKAKSAFDFDVPRQVATATHAGLSFLRDLRQDLPDIHVWPFDGWTIPDGASCLVEARAHHFKGLYDRNDLSVPQHNAFTIASWLRDADRNEQLASAFWPDLSDKQRLTAMYEGWIMGVSAAAAVPKPAQKPKVSTPRRRQPVSHTTSGYCNLNGQIVIRAAGQAGLDSPLQIYQMACSNCGLNYGAREADVAERMCPSCGGGKPGLVI
jgi:hypothetical protein